MRNLDANKAELSSFRKGPPGLTPSFWPGMEDDKPVADYNKIIREALLGLIYKDKERPVATDDLLGYGMSPDDIRYQFSKTPPEGQFTDLYNYRKK